MNVETGEIQEFESANKLQQAMRSGTWIAVDKMPDPNCRKCYGRGHLGKNLSTNLYVPCSCVKKEADAA